jgi:hypothetical protein
MMCIDCIDAFGVAKVPGGAKEAYRKLLASLDKLLPDPPSVNMRRTVLPLLLHLLPLLLLLVLLLLLQVNYNEFSRRNSDEVLNDLTAGRIPNVHAWRDQVRRHTSAAAATLQSP